MTLTEPQIGAMIATFARATGLVATAPVVGDNGIPLRARLVLVIAIVATVGVNRPEVALADVAEIATIELAIGLVTGLAARFVLARAAVAGQLFGLSLGLGFAAQYDIHAGESAGTLRTLVSALAGLAFLAAGGLEAIVQSAAAGPAHPGQLALLGPMLLDQGCSAFGHGLALAAPIVLAAVVGNLGLALIGRAAPAANVFSISLPGVLVVGALALLGSTGELAQRVHHHARAAVDVLVGSAP
jgi:flagellar biosynthetic protein FliR